MRNNDLIRFEDRVFRVLEIRDNDVLVIDCIKRQMPKWIPAEELKEYISCTEDDLQTIAQFAEQSYDELSPTARKVCHERYTLIAPIIPFVADEKARSAMIEQAANRNQVSKQTVRKYLISYLCSQALSSLAPPPKAEKELTADEKNYRWALNKYYYNWRKNSLRDAYTAMLKEKYTSADGQLPESYPSFYQFAYFFRKHKDFQSFYIKREGKSAYQKNHRPLLGAGIQDFAPAVGVGMVDSTVADVFLINTAGEIIGRPNITVCVDAYSAYCMGYFLSWEGGIYSVQGLMRSIVSDKVQVCRDLGIEIGETQWDSNQMPAVLVTDNGREYAGTVLEQVAELGISVTNLPPYRPDLEGAVEQFFDLLQESYRPFLTGKGFISENFQGRGAPDYRSQACLTLEQFEKIVVYCILYYNNSRALENFPYTTEMINAGVKPNAASVFAFGKNRPGANLISLAPDILSLTLRPRTTGRFTRKGLIVNKLRYKAEGFNERYLSGGTVTVAYDPDNVSSVWLFEDGKYTRFSLIDANFEGQDLEAVEANISARQQLIQASAGDNLQARINLAAHIEAIVGDGNKGEKKKRIPAAKEKEKAVKHIETGDIIHG